ncbi:unnamed protein product [Pieris macdunnoughi]|uniref:Phenoloxidase-activating factor 2 n=1 Tax=Pieris macdunnoughi TaxID=345717 RepID=A0A821X8W3_9NEOP|nr:unnamed protein product [Pieris macdunnoughi]
MLKCVLFILSIGFAANLNLNPGKKDADTCMTKDNDAGICVVYYQCNENGTVNTDGVGILDERSGDLPCPSYLDTCCKMSDTRGTDDPITPKPIHRQGCGWRNPNGIDPLIRTGKTGDIARFGEFPWMVALLQVQPLSPKEPGATFNLYIGGGSLIHTSVVLTAAHLVKTAHHYRARAGEWDTQTDKEVFPYQERDVADVVIHEKFNKRNLHYDIALLFLESEVKLAPNVGVVCLPISEADGEKCFASGWGKDQFGKEGRYQVILKKVELPVLNHDVCQTQLRKTRLGKYFQLSKTFMCAGGGDQDTCRGDGGSPLSCPLPYQEDRYAVSGIVSWGIGCGQTGNPGVYVNVATFRSWIDENVARRGFDTKMYTYLL